MIDIAPTRLRASLVTVRVQHPYPLQGEIVPNDRVNADTERLWAELLLLQGTGLDKRLLRMTQHEVRVACYGARDRLKDKEVIRVLARFFGLGLGETQPALAFDAFIVSNGAREFRPDAERHAIASGIQSGLEIALDAAYPIEGLAAGFKQTGKKLEDWLKEPAPAKLGAEVRKALTLVLLSHSELESTVAREGPAMVLRMVEKHLDRDAQVHWYRAYLSHGAKKGWRVNDPVLKQIVHEFRAPNEQSSFWTLVDADTREAVTNWIKETDLHLLLGDSERVKFWKRFLKQLERTEASLDKKAVFIIFPKWYACQFKEAGVATYLFPRTRLSEMKKLAGNLLVQAVREGEALDRYEHRGFRWRSRADRIVRRIMRETEG